MAVRPANPKRVSVDVDGPTCVLKVSGLDDDTSEDTLYRLFSAHAPVAEVSATSLSRIELALVSHGDEFMNVHNCKSSNVPLLLFCYHLR